MARSDDDEEFNKIKKSCKEYQKSLWKTHELVRLYINGKFYSVIR